MAHILSIESSTNVCSVAVHENGELIASANFYLPQSHSALLPQIIQNLLSSCSLKFHHLDAVAVSGGPGSYTGLRIGVSSAKGIAFAASLPLIALNSLEIMCELPSGMISKEALLCPMIDARRMEVYCLLRKADGKSLWKTQPLIVESDSFQEYTSSPIYFFGNGSSKCREVLNDNNHFFIDDIAPEAQYMGKKAFEQFQAGIFEDLAYYEPNYLKEYRTNKPAVKF